MRKTIVFLATLTVFLTGCGANNNLENKDSPQDTDSQSETGEIQEQAADSNKELVPISTKTFEDIWKLTTYQNPDSVKNISEWKPKPLDYKGELQKKWSLYSKYLENRQPRYHINEPYRSYPDSWGVFDMFLSAQNNNTYLSGFLNPETGEFSENTNSLGITDGENIYIDDSWYYNPGCCVRLSDKKVLWETIVIGGFCSDIGPVRISDNCLINIQDCRGDPNQIVKRINTATGKPVWVLELMDSAQLSGKYSIYNAESTHDSMLIEVFQLFYEPEEGKFIKSELHGLYRIKSADGSVTKIKNDRYYFEPDLKGIDDTLWITLENDKIYRLTDSQSQPSLFEPNKELKANHKIKSLSIAGSLNGKILFYATIADKNKEYISLLYDPLTSETKELFIKDIKNNNGTFYVDEKDRFVGIDLETGETTWTLLKEKGKNLSIRLIDWRGVLVYQDNQLVCYAPK